MEKNTYYYNVQLAVYYTSFLSSSVFFTGDLHQQIFELEIFYSGGIMPVQTS
jgi:hypothetical protein